MVATAKVKLMKGMLRLAGSPAWRADMYEALCELATRLKEIGVPEDIRREVIWPHVESMFDACTQRVVAERKQRVAAKG